MLTISASAASAEPIGQALRGLWDSSSRCSEGHKLVANSEIEARLDRRTIAEDESIDTFCAAMRQGEGKLAAQCYAKCETEHAEEFAARKDAQRRAAREELERADRESKAALEKQGAAEQQRADLKAGVRKPSNIDEAAIAYDARSGNSIVSSPKLRPDGAMYYLHGQLKVADDKPAFFAVTSMSKTEELNLAVYNLRGIGPPVVVNARTDYFKAVIPKNLQDYYFDHARIEGGFDMVGRYVGNTKHKDALGQDKTVPVFDIVYFVVW